MAWSFRKSARLGPFRINFSKSGIGASFGVKGARISAGPRGTYVNLGSHGIYYRKRIDSNKTVPPPTPVPVALVEQHTITTVNFESLTDVDSQEFIQELEEKTNRIYLTFWLGLIPCLFLLLVLIAYLYKVVRSDEVYLDTFTITSKSAHIRKTASLSGDVLISVKAFQTLKRIPKDSDQWVHVLLPGSQSSGYVHHSLGKTDHTLVFSENVRFVDENPIISGVLLAMGVGGSIAFCIWLYGIDRRRKTLVINYVMDDKLENLHKEFLSCFKEFSASEKIWQKLFAQRTNNTKYNAGASELVQRVSLGSISINRKPTSFLKTNVAIPYIGLRNTSLFFFPERIVLKRGVKFAALQYKHLCIEIGSVRFIETDSVPSDSEIIDYTWKYPNKTGGPDKRFRDNVRIPICRYSEYHFHADSGLNEIISTSKVGAMDRLVEFLRIIGKFQESVNGVMASN